VGCQIKTNDPARDGIAPWAFCSTNTLKEVSVTQKVQDAGRTVVSFGVLKEDLVRCVLWIDVGRVSYYCDSYIVPVGILQAKSNKQRE
jgi:hypothetical protein